MNLSISLTSTKSKYHSLPCVSRSSRVIIKRKYWTASLQSSIQNQTRVRCVAVVVFTNVALNFVLEPVKAVVPYNVSWAKSDCSCQLWFQSCLSARTEMMNLCLLEYSSSNKFSWSLLFFHCRSSSSFHGRTAPRSSKEKSSTHVWKIQK